MVKEPWFFPSWAAVFPLRYHSIHQLEMNDGIYNDNEIRSQTTGILPPRLLSCRSEAF
ncbi:hypothetical protein LOK49_LG03G01808 [Camellia lanceoleosa]|uniref:Uncharacterized protein n=1 Tax=Camellia lanceoleosa TaxID=1840588 RepID=A0ACC0IBR6_9ERIC|nr:hypothetical protein LOK49_LG03G01808 [Camellia lanceoleosa]